MARESRVPLCLASSHGGHMELLLAVEEAWRDVPHAIVTAPSRQADALRARGERVHLVVNPGRNPLRVLFNAVQAVRLAVGLRPRVVVSPGANVALAFCVATRLLGARLVFIETMARVHSGSLTGRLLHRLSHAFLVQWPELLRVYPRAELCRPALLEQIAPAMGGRGTFVAAGSHDQPFDRLLRLADEAVGDGTLPAPVLAQAAGTTYAPRTFQTVETLEPAAVERAAAEHELVVCHGGSGLIALALRSGKTPIVLPRRGGHGEHVDDHQVAMVAKLAELGLVASLDELPVEAAVRRAREHAARQAQPAAGAPLAERLRELISVPR